MVQVICTICQTPYHCRGRISCLWFAKFDTQEHRSSTPEKSSTLLHHVEIRPYFGGVLHTTVDFMENIEATVNLKCVARGSLKIPRRQFNLESGHIRLSLRVKDAAWEPVVGLEKWNATSRTFTEEKGLLDVIDLDYCHKCRNPPYEAAIYSLEAEGEMLEKFRANVNAVLTVEIEESSEEQKETAKEHSYLALPMDFTKEDVARPSNTERLSAKGKTDTLQPVRKKKSPRLSREEIDSRVEIGGFDQLPSEIHDREIARLAALFSPDTLATIAMEHFDVSEAKVHYFKADRRENTEGFKRDLLTYYRNKDRGRKDLYRILLEAESKGILDDVDMTKVEKLILDPEGERKPVKRSRDVTKKSTRSSTDKTESRMETTGFDLEARGKHISQESKSPLGLSTLCQAKAPEEMTDIFPRSSLCPMTTTRKGKIYLGTIPNGKITSLQGDKSDVKLEIKRGCPKELHLMTVKTDVFSFRSFIRENECFISPIVEVLAPAETSTSSYTLRIPHCLDKEDDRSKVIVRLLHKNRNPAVVEVPKGNSGALYYEIDDRFIELHTTHFTQVICTICQTPYKCMGKIIILWYAKCQTHHRNVSHQQTLNNDRPFLHHDVEIRPYFCGDLQTMYDFNKDSHLDYKTRGCLSISINDNNLESDQVQISLKVREQGWQPTQGLDEWYSATNTFSKKISLKHVLAVIDGHQCHVADLHDSIIYSLDGQNLTMFRGTGRIELISNENVSSQQQQLLRQVEMPINLYIDWPGSKKRKRELVKSDDDDDVDQRSAGSIGKGKKIADLRRIEMYAALKMNKVKIDQLPPDIKDREIARLAPLFGPSTLETIALQHFEISQAKVSQYNKDRREDGEGVKRDLLTYYINKDHKRKDLYRVLLMSELEGILDSADMANVENILLNPP